MGRTALPPSARLLNHAEMFYAPGDRAAARALFRAIGCRVLDPQEEAGPADLGPAAGPYLIVFVDPERKDLIDNVMYCSEVDPAQWRLEQGLRAAIEKDAGLRARYDAYQTSFASQPQAMTHVGVALGEDGLARAFEALQQAPELAGRVRLAGPFRPGEPGSVDPRVIQGFVRTDVVSTGLLLAGQQIELQVRID
ncbi:MAG: hypothetical protein R3F35_16390 [Myxococcota bacterium]